MIERREDRRFTDLIEVATAGAVKAGEEVPPAGDDIGEVGAHLRALDGRFDDDPHAAGRLRALLAEECELRVDLLDHDELLRRAADLLTRDVLRWRRRDVPRERGEDVATPVPVGPVDPVDPVDPPVDHDYALSLTGPAHLASGAETVEFVYAVSDPDGITTGITIRLLRQHDSAELKRFSASDHAHGPHPLPWDGAVAHGDFANGYANIRHSPYVVEATLHGPKGDRARRHTIAVELVEFKVRLALASTLGRAADRAVHAQVPYVPVSGKQKLFLTSDLYATQSAEMEDNTAFTAYQTLWGDGPRLPLEVVTRVRASTGAPVPAAKALGDARVLWDHDDAPRSRSTYLSVAAKAFVDRARAYDLAAARPAGGDNAHVDRGGKRAAAGGSDIFVAPDGEVSGFPYTSAPGGTRWWSTFSDFVQGGDREGMTGVVFRPARAAGDNYRVRAYLDLDRALDTADVTPTGAARTVDVGEFEVWRRITLRAHWRKTAAITAALPSVVGYYADACMDVDDQMGAAQQFNRATYDAAFNAARGAVDPAMIPALMRRYSLLPGNQYDLARPPDSFGGAVLRWFGDAGRWIANLFGANLSPSPTTWVCTFRPYADFKEAVRSGEGFSDAQLAAALANITADTEGRYAERGSDYASEIATEMCKAKATASGVTILQFDWTHSLEEPANDGRLNGNAVFKTRDTCGFALYNPRQDTTGHEIGHDLFIPHAPRLRSDGSVINSGGGITPDAHDVNEMSCLMSYARPRPGFCGLCVVRLAGWDRTVFDRNGPTVTK